MRWGLSSAAHNRKTLKQKPYCFVSWNGKCRGRRFRAGIPAPQFQQGPRLLPAAACSGVILLLGLARQMLQRQWWHRGRQQGQVEEKSTGTQGARESGLSFCNRLSCCLSVSGGQCCLAAHLQRRLGNVLSFNWTHWDLPWTQDSVCCTLTWESREPDGIYFIRISQWAFDILFVVSFLISLLTKMNPSFFFKIIEFYLKVLLKQPLWHWVAGPEEGH